MINFIVVISSDIAWRICSGCIYSIEENKIGIICVASFGLLLILADIIFFILVNSMRGKPTSGLRFYLYQRPLISPSVPEERHIHIWRKLFRYVYLIVSLKNLGKPKKNQSS